LLLEGRVRVYRPEAGGEVTIGILEAGAVGHVGRHIVVNDTVALQRIAEDAA
jgi:hypothetical protein